MATPFDFLTELELKKRCREFYLPESESREDMIKNLNHLRQVVSTMSGLRTTLTGQADSSKENDTIQLSQSSTASVLTASSSSSTPAARSTPQKNLQPSRDDSNNLSSPRAKRMKGSEDSAVQRELYPANVPGQSSKQTSREERLANWQKRGNQVIGLGKFKGQKTFLEIYQTDQGYCKWVRELSNPGAVSAFRDWLNER